MKTKFSTKKLLRYGGSFAVFAIFLMLTALQNIFPNFYNTLCSALYDVRGQAPFVDLGDILQAGVCWRRGVNVYVPSNCLDGGVFNYSPILLYVARLPIDVSDRAVAGGLMAVGFMASLSLFPAPRSFKELAFRCIALASTATWYAVEQGNLDLCLFTIIMLGLWLICNNSKLSLISYALFGVAAAAKFYPAILFGLGLRERITRLIVVGLTGCVLGILVVAIYGSSILKVFSIIPLSQPFRATFGASDLFSGLALLHILPWHSATHVIRPFYPSITLLSAHQSSNFYTLLMGLGALVWAWKDAKYYSLKMHRVSAHRRIFLVASALIIVLCFFATQNVYYRGIFLLLAIPGIWDLACLGSGKIDRRVSLVLALVLVLLWEAAFRLVVHEVIVVLFPTWVEEVAMIGLWLARELAWWWLIVQFSALIIVFFRQEIIRLHGDAIRLLP